MLVRPPRHPAAAAKAASLALTAVGRASSGAGISYRLMSWKPRVRQASRRVMMNHPTFVPAIGMLHLVPGGAYLSPEENLEGGSTDARLPDTHHGGVSKGPIVTRKAGASLAVSPLDLRTIGSPTTQV